MPEHVNLVTCGSASSHHHQLALDFARTPPYFPGARKSEHWDGFYATFMMVVCVIIVIVADAHDVNRWKLFDIARLLGVSLGPHKLHWTGENWIK